MTDGPQAVIEFSDGTQLEISDTVEQVKNALDGVGSPHIPLMRVRDVDGNELWINAAHIRALGPFDTESKSAHFLFRGLTTRGRRGRSGSS